MKAEESLHEVHCPCSEFDEFFANKKFDTKRCSVLSIKSTIKKAHLQTGPIQKTA